MHTMNIHSVTALRVDLTVGRWESFSNSEPNNLGADVRLDHRRRILGSDNETFVSLIRKC